MRQLLLLAAKHDLPAHAIDDLVAADIDQPGARIGWRIFFRPALQRHRERILQRVLCEIEITNEADQRRQRAARLVTKYLFDIGGSHLTTLHISPSFRGALKPRTSDAQLRIGEPRDSGFARAMRARPGMTERPSIIHPDRPHLDRADPGAGNS